MDPTKMTLEEYINLNSEAMKSFAETYSIKTKADPKNFPTVMSGAKWDDTFIEFFNDFVTQAFEVPHRD
jgi:hypothetical protein